MDKLTASHVLSPDTQAILLLCSNLGQIRPTETKPLCQSEYNQLAQSLLANNLRPSHLLDSEGLSWLENINRHNSLDRKRITTLLNRGGALALAIENWTNQGLWILSRSDEQYPKRLKAQLKHAAPSILYGAGNQNLLSNGGLSIVGARDADDEALAFARQAACLCARQEIQVISGGARGVDAEAMLSALNEGGRVVGIINNSLAKEALSRKYREALRQGNLVLVSPYEPQIRFYPSNALNCNKYIYTLSDMALVVSAALNQGGTWAGAVENLRNNWVPLFVLLRKEPSDGNKHLIEQGGIAIDQSILLKERLTNWLNSDKLFSRLEPALTETAILEEQKVSFEVFLDRDEQQRFKAMCIRNGKTIQQVVSELIKQYISTETVIKKEVLPKDTNLNQREAISQQLYSSTPSDKKEIKSKNVPLDLVSTNTVLESRLLELNPILIQGLTRKALSERLKVQPSTVSKNQKRGREKFMEWSRQRDPDNIAWEYLVDSQMFYPLNLAPTKELIFTIK